MQRSCIKKGTRGIRCQCDNGKTVQSHNLQLKATEMLSAANSDMNSC